MEKKRRRMGEVQGTMVLSTSFKFDTIPIKLKRLVKATREISYRREVFCNRDRNSFDTYEELW